MPYDWPLCTIVYLIHHTRQHWTNKLYKNVSKCSHLPKLDITKVHAQITMLKIVFIKYICSSDWAQYVKCLENLNGICFSTLQWEPQANKSWDKNVSSMNFGNFTLTFEFEPKIHPVEHHSMPILLDNMKPTHLKMQCVKNGDSGLIS